MRGRDPSEGALAIVENEAPLPFARGDLRAESIDGIAHLGRRALQQPNIANTRERELFERGIGADEAGDHLVCRVRQNGLRSVVLHDRRLVTEHRDAIAQLHCLVEVVGDEHDGLAEFGLQPHQFVLKQSASDRIDRAERFVHQQDRGVGCQRPSHPDPLLLSAGQLPGVAVAIGIRVEADEVEHLVGAGSDALLVPPDQTGNGTDVLCDGQMGKQPGLLDRVSDAAAQFVGVDGQCVLAVDGDGARRRFDQTVDHPHRGRLPTTRWTHEDHGFARRDRQGDVVDCCGVLTGVPLADGIEHDLDAGDMLPGCFSHEYPSRL